MGYLVEGSLKNLNIKPHFGYGYPNSNSYLEKDSSGGQAKALFSSTVLIVGVILLLSRNLRFLSLIIIDVRLIRLSFN